MTRKPIPPRIPSPKQKKMTPAEITADLKQRLPIRPQTFKEAQARELEILPPNFTEAHLATKKPKVREEEKMAGLKRPKTAMSKTSKQSTVMKPVKFSNKSPVNVEDIDESQVNTIDSLRNQEESRDVMMQRSRSQMTSQRSAPAQDISQIQRDHPKRSR